MPVFKESIIRNGDVDDGDVDDDNNNDDDEELIYDCECYLLLNKNLC
jgi:hypothetical protein